MGRLSLSKAPIEPRTSTVKFACPRRADRSPRFPEAKSTIEDQLVLMEGGLLASQSEFKTVMDSIKVTLSTRRKLIRPFLVVLRELWRFRSRLRRPPIATMNHSFEPARRELQNELKSNSKRCWWRCWPLRSNENRWLRCSPLCLSNSIWAL